MKDKIIEIPLDTEFSRIYALIVKAAYPKFLAPEFHNEKGIALIHRVQREPEFQGVDYRTLYNKGAYYRHKPYAEYKGIQLSTGWYGSKTIRRVMFQVDGDNYLVNVTKFKAKVDELATMEKERVESAAVSAKRWEKYAKWEEAEKEKLSQAWLGIPYDDDDYQHPVKDVSVSEAQPEYGIPVQYNLDNLKYKHVDLDTFLKVQALIKEYTDGERKKLEEYNAKKTA